MDPLAERQLIEAIEKLGSGISGLAEAKYTLTGAADWPILVLMVGVIAAMVAFMWLDLRSTIKENRGEWRTELKTAEDQIWEEIRRCQEKCQNK